MHPSGYVYPACGSAGWYVGTSKIMRGLLKCFKGLGRKMILKALPNVCVKNSPLEKLDGHPRFS